MNKFTVVMPIAGKGKRFTDIGCTVRKPLIRINDKPMALHALECLPKEIIDEVIFVMPNDFSDHEIEVAKHLRPPGWYDIHFKWAVEPRQRGQATTVLHGLKEHKVVGAVLTMNCDQMISYTGALDYYLLKILKGRSNGHIPVFDSLDRNLREANSKWSYVYPKMHYTTTSREVTDEIDGVIEKPTRYDDWSEPIVGLFAFQNSFGLVEAIEQTVLERQRVNNEYYMGTVVNHYLERRPSLFGSGWPMFFNPCNAMGIGTPEDLDSAFGMGWRNENEFKTKQT